MNAINGLKAPKIAAEMVKLISTARSDWSSVMFNPNNGASMAFNKALPNIVNRMMNGNLMATNNAWKAVKDSLQRRHQGTGIDPIATTGGWLSCHPLTH